jgi:hypothetical protein
MEFFRLERLKSKLVRGPLPANETAKYLAAQGALSSLLFIASPEQDMGGWPYIAFPALSVLGVYYCYRCQGGAIGERFAERYLSVGWVVAVRVAAAVVPLFFAALVALVVTNGFESSWWESPWFDDIFEAAMLGVVGVAYWRTGVHLSAIHRTTSAPQSALFSVTADT